ncbi:MAG: adenylate/guanylate cyclase domain-containing protein, partial [Halobacteriovoraceae bacterium]|nr:adenylate/guanylate cyclase domain-containing protein [Halobacteriovoraceae bacterium]
SERQKSESLLLNILPPKIAQRLKNNERNIALTNPKAAILFADLVGYTSFSKDKSPEEVVSLLNEIFSRFDEETSLLKLEKIKTIGDSYMVAGGLFVEEDEAKEVLELAKGLNTILLEINEEYKTEFKVRIGIHTGPIVAGVIGKIKFSFDIWGNTVNQASRLESMGVPGRIHISQEYYNSLVDKGINVGDFEPNSFKAKGLGELSSFLL